MTTIHVQEAVGSYPHRDEDAMKLYQTIHAGLSGGGDVLVDFTGVKFILPPFLMGVIGGQCEQYRIEELSIRLRYSGLEPTLEALIPAILTRASRFFAAPKEVQDALIHSERRRFEDDL